MAEDYVRYEGKLDFNIEDKESTTLKMLEVLSEINKLGFEKFYIACFPVLDKPIDYYCIFDCVITSIHCVEGIHYISAFVSESSTDGGGDITPLGQYCLIHEASGYSELGKFVIDIYGTIKEYISKIEGETIDNLKLKFIGPEEPTNILPPNMKNVTAVANRSTLHAMVSAKNICENVRDMFVNYALNYDYMEHKTFEDLVLNEDKKTYIQSFAKPFKYVIDHMLKGTSSIIVTIKMDIPIEEASEELLEKLADNDSDEGYCSTASQFFLTRCLTLYNNPAMGNSQPMTYIMDFCNHQELNRHIELVYTVQNLFYRMLQYAMTNTTAMREFLKTVNQDYSPNAKFSCIVSTDKKDINFEDYLFDSLNSVEPNDFYNLYKTIHENGNTEGILHMNNNGGEKEDS
jgi:hypothetical protein